MGIPRRVEHHRDVGIYDESWSGVESFWRSLAGDRVTGQELTDKILTFER